MNRLEKYFPHFTSIVNSCHISYHIPFKQLFIIRTMRSTDNPPRALSFLCHFLIIGKDHRYCTLPKQRDLILQFIRKPDIITIQESDITTFCCFNTYIAWFLPVSRKMNPSERNESACPAPYIFL